MTDETKPPIPRLIRACIFWALILTSLYGGIYSSLVYPGLAIRTGRTRFVPRYSEHRLTQKALDIVFWPAFQIDYYVRPAIWQAEFADSPMMMRSERSY